MIHEIEDIDEITCGLDDEFVIALEVDVTYFDYQPPSMKSAWHCDNPDEYYGHTDIEWDVLKYSIYDDEGELVVVGNGWPDTELYPFDQDKVEEILVEYEKQSREDY